MAGRSVGAWRCAKPRDFNDVPLPEDLARRMLEGAHKGVCPPGERPARVNAS
jgi:hypothetical protein